MVRRGWRREVESGMEEVGVGGEMGGLQHSKRLSVRQFCVGVRVRHVGECMEI